MADGIDFKELDRQTRVRDVEISIEGTSAAAGGGHKRARRHSDPLDLWYKREVITDRQYDAGCWLRECYERAQRSPPGSAYDGVPAPDNFGPSAIADHQLVASRKLAVAKGRLGLFIYLDLIAFCCEGEKVTGDRFDKGKWQGRITAALDILAHYRGMKA